MFGSLPLHLDDTAVDVRASVLRAGCFAAGRVSARHQRRAQRAEAARCVVAPLCVCVCISITYLMPSETGWLRTTHSDSSSLMRYVYSSMVARMGDLMFVAVHLPVIGVSDRTWRQVGITCVDEVVVVDLEDVLGVCAWIALRVVLGGEHFACVLADERLLFKVGRGEDAQALRCTGVAYLDQA